MGKKTTYLCCPCCGKSSLIRNFLDGAAGRHVLAAKIQKALAAPGVMCGFEWSSREISPEELQLVADAVATVSRRLQRLRLPSRAETVQTREEAEQYLREAEDELRFRRQEVKHLLEEDS